MNHKTVIILCVSREILEGVVVDRNAAFMATRVFDMGFRVRTVQVVDRVESEMVAAVHWALEQKPDFLITTGGMGPGHDDNSRACAAKAAGITLVESAKALEQVKNAYRRLHAQGSVGDEAIHTDRARMAMVPEGAVTYENPIGSAPVVHFQSNGTTVFLLPGVPTEMQRCFTLYVLPAMMAQGPSTLRKSRHIDYPGSDESAIARVVQDVARRHREVKVQTRCYGPDSGPIRITLTAEHHDPLLLEEMLDRAEMDFRSRVGLEMSLKHGHIDHESGD